MKEGSPFDRAPHFHIIAARARTPGITCILIFWMHARCRNILIMANWRVIMEFHGASGAAGRPAFLRIPAAAAKKPPTDNCPAFLRSMSVRAARETRGTYFSGASGIRRFPDEGARDIRPDSSATNRACLQCRCELAARKQATRARDDRV